MFRVVREVTYLVMKKCSVSRFSTSVSCYLTGYIIVYLELTTLILVTIFRCYIVAFCRLYFAQQTTYIIKLPNFTVS